MHYAFGEYEFDTELRTLRRGGVEVEAQDRAYRAPRRLNRIV